MRKRRSRGFGSISSKHCEKAYEWVKQVERNVAALEKDLMPGKQITRQTLDHLRWAYVGKVLADCHMDSATKGCDPSLVRSLVRDNAKLRELIKQVEDTILRGGNE